MFFICSLYILFNLHLYSNTFFELFIPLIFICFIFLLSANQMHAPMVTSTFLCTRVLEIIKKKGNVIPINLFFYFIHLSYFHYMQNRIRPAAKKQF